MSKYLFQLRRGWKWDCDPLTNEPRDDWSTYEQKDGHIKPCEGEPVLEYVNGYPKLKIGDGVREFSQLPYIADDIVFEQLNADWEEVDVDSPSYIKNKPDIGAIAGEIISDRLDEFHTLASTSEFNEEDLPSEIYYKLIDTEWKAKDEDGNELDIDIFENIRFTTVSDDATLLGDVFTYIDEWGNRRYTLSSDYTPHIATDTVATVLSDEFDPEKMLYSIKLEAKFNGVGKYALGNKNFSLVSGMDVVAAGGGATALGKEQFVSGSNASSFGRKNFVRGNTATAFGYNNIATGLHSVALNEANKAIGYASFVWGDHNTVFGAHSTAGGWNNKTDGQYSSVKGSQNTVDGSYNEVHGQNNNCKGQHNLHVGKGSTVDGAYNFNNGYNNTIKGNNNTINAMNSDVIASFSTIFGIGNSIVEGKQNGHIVNGTNNKITAKTSYKNILNGEGNEITYVGDPDSPEISGTGYSIVSGVNNIVKSRFGAAIGEGLDVQGHYGTQLVLGKYNTMDKWAHFIVGNGKSDTQRNNIFVIKNDGRAVLGADPKNNMDAATKQYVDATEARIGDQIGDISAALDELIKLQESFIPKTSNNLFNIAALANDTGSKGLLSVTIDSIVQLANEDYFDSGESTMIILRDICPRCEVGKTYTLSYEAEYGGYDPFCVAYLTVKGKEYNNPSTFVMTETMLNSPLQLFAAEYDEGGVNCYSVGATFTKIMLNEGDTALPYEPYRG